MSQDKEKDIPSNFQFALGEIYSRLNTSEKKISQLEDAIDKKIVDLRDHIDNNIESVKKNMDSKVDGIELKIDKLVDEVQKERLERSVDVSKREGAWKTITIIASIFVALGTVFSSVAAKIVTFLTT